MKKNFPIIFILISLSLVGMIYIQWNWILTMVENKHEELQHKLVDVTKDIGGELISYKEASSSMKGLPFSQGNAFRPSDQFPSELMKVPSIAQRFTKDEINDKIRKSLNYYGLKNTKFEF
ncbi:MAG TPA: hypothetical protein VMH01_04535, partial [Puia sp.]|nr:hypothetical protein [Puia sp.]